MRTPTITAIKYATRAGSDSHFFDRDSMRFFGQTLRDFRVRKSPKGRIFIYAVRGKHGVRSFREYIPGKRAGQSPLRLPNGGSGMTLSGIQRYIAAH